QLEQVDDPFRARKKISEIRAGRDALRDLRRIEPSRPGGRRIEVPTRLVPPKQVTSRAREDLCNRVYRRFLDIRFVRARERLDKAQPFDAIVVLVPVEMLVDEDARLPSQVRGGQNSRQGYCRTRNEDELTHRSPIAAKLAHVEAAERHHDQVR